MSLLVQKYGGTSVGDVDRIKNVAKRIIESQNNGNKVVAVVSAMSGVTNNLISLAGKISQKPTRREMDVLLSTGEQTTIALMSMAINELGGKAISLTGGQAGIFTEGSHTKARIANITSKKIQNYLKDDFIVIVAGFQGISDSGHITTLGRGGSDLTAIAIAGVLKADLCQIFTDVDGVYTCDPRVVKKVQKIHTISYEEMLEMSSLGSKVMQSRSVEFAKKYDVKFEVRSSMDNLPGTLVTSEKNIMENPVVRGVSFQKSQAKVTLSGVHDKPGVASEIFNVLAKNEIVIDMIVQNVSKTGVTDISFTLDQSEVSEVESILGEMLNRLGEGAEVDITKNIAKLSVVGIGMRSHSGVAAEMFSALAKEDVNIQMISTSEIKISLTIDEKDLEKSAKAVHTAFGLDKED